MSVSTRTKPYPVSRAPAGMARRRFLALAATLAMALPLAAAGAPAKRAPVAKPPQKERVVIQVSDSDPKKWNLALNVAKELERDFGEGKIEIEVVAFGAGVKMLTHDGDVGNRVENALARRIRFYVCGASMRALNLDKDDILDNVGTLPIGSAHIVRRQRQGWTYLRP